MDVDCDGSDDKAGDCSNDPTGYGETAFKDTVQSYGISDLNANIHPYVVFNEPPFFNPEQYGMKPLSVMAVVCNNQVVSYVFGVIFFCARNTIIFKSAYAYWFSFFPPFSGMVSGAIPTQSRLQAKQLFHLRSCASPTMV